MTSLIGQTVSHYRILEQVGKGGMGTVYKAEDTRLHRTVALKFLNPEMLLDDREKSRFTHEAEAAAQLGHPNIATVYDFEDHLDPGTQTRHAFIAMEFIDGQPLKRKLERGPLPFDEIESIARQLAAALQAAHQKGIVHRDVKPANIIIRDDGSVKVLDFGVAKLAGETRVTAAGQVVGSIAYMSPEQLQGIDVDLRSDIWSFGVVLYEMLTSHFPFRGDHAAAVVYSIANEDPPPPTSDRKEIPPPLADVCMSCLRKNPAERPESMGAVLSILAGITRPRPEKRRTAARIPSYWRPAAAALGTIALLAVLALAVPDIRKGIDRIFRSGTRAQRIMVVLPFTPIDSSGDSRSYCAGLSWMVPSRLAELMKGEGSISLVGSTDVSKYAVTNSAEARKVLGASLVITGGMQRIGDIVRLTVDLFDAASNRHVDSRYGTYAVGRYTSMEDDAIRDVIEMLGIKIPATTEGNKQRGTADDEAYQFYAQGRGYLLQYQKTENLQIAADLFTKAIRRDSLFAQAHAGLGEADWRLYSATNDTFWIVKATAAAAKAIDLKASLPEAQITMGLIHTGTGSYEQASRDFENAIALDPRNTLALRGLAGAYNSLGRFAEAESTLRHAISLNPTYWAEYNALGFFYYTRGRYQEAASQFRKVTELTPDNADGFNNLGAMYIFSQSWKEAREALEHAVKLSPTSSSYSNLGSVYFYLKEFHEASRSYAQALSVDSSDYRVWGSLAASQYWAPGEQERSQRSYRRAATLAEVKRKVDPRDAEVLSHLANFYAFIGEKQKALPLLEQSLQGSKNAPEFFERGAEAYNVMGEQSKAVECLRRALEAGADPGLVLLNPALKELVNHDEIRGLLKKR
jgi:serine/threonine protein kinase/tetratricopeptide (TPR) repeat protein